MLMQQLQTLAKPPPVKKRPADTFYAAVGISNTLRIASEQFAESEKRENARREAERTEQQRREEERMRVRFGHD